MFAGKGVDLWGVLVDDAPPLWPGRVQYHHTVLLTAD